MNYTESDLVKKVRIIERQNFEYSHLVGSMLATLKVNLERGTLVAVNPNGENLNRDFQEVLDGWNKQADIIQDGNWTK